MASQHFSKEDRLCSSRRIETLFSEGERLYEFPFKAIWQEYDTLQSTVKVAISVPKKRLSKASQRNHIKRLVREAYRKQKSILTEKLLQEKLKANKKIEIIWDSIVEEVIGTTEPKGVNGIKIKNVKTSKTSDLKVDGLFIAIGHDPATSLFKDQLKMDKEGYLITAPDSTITNIPGVFAAGDVKDKIFRQAVTAAGMGCMAALEAEKHLSSK